MRYEYASCTCLIILNKSLYIFSLLVSNSCNGNIFTKMSKMIKQA